jgi:hypothetical protein
MVVEPIAGDRLEDNLNPGADFNYAGSMMICVPTSLSQEVGAAPGASRRSTGSRGNRGGRLPERQARDGRRPSPWFCRRDRKTMAGIARAPTTSPAACP